MTVSSPIAPIEYLRIGVFSLVRMLGLMNRRSRSGGGTMIAWAVPRDQQMIAARFHR
jgi:hypothetical protein